MTATPPPTGPLTREQYHKLGDEGHFDRKRVELIFGEVVEMSPIGWLHRVATGRVADALALAFATGFFVEVQQPFAIPGVPRGSEPQPDVSVTPGAQSDYTDHPTVATLLVEVADATVFYDLTTKAELYATANVPEYWVLDIPNRQLHVFRDPQPLSNALGATAYQTHLVLAPTDTVNPLGAPHATITVSDLLP
jgi:Uma2 family endonuclease